MRRIVAGSLGLSLSLWAAAAVAQQGAQPQPRICRIYTVPAESVNAGRPAQILTWTESPGPVVRAQMDDADEKGVASACRVAPNPTDDGPVVPVACNDCGCTCSGCSCCGCPCCWDNDVVRGGIGCRFFAGADYLLWWLKDGPAPALLTTGPAGVFPPGALFQQGTVILADGNHLTANPFSGGRFFAGFWLDERQCWGVEGRGFFLAERSTSLTVGSDAFPVLSRPFFDVLGHQQFVETIGQPGLARGQFHLEAPARLWGAEGNLRRNLWCADCGWLDLLAGFRYLDLDEGLFMSERTFGIGPPVVGQTRIGVDRFQTENQFYGGQLGAVAESRFGRFSCQLRGTVGLGNTHQSVTISGSQLAIFPNGVQTVSPGNLLALPTNIGVWSANRFAVVPEVGVNLGYQATAHMRFNAGYTLLYWSSVMRPGDQVNLNINPTQIPNFTPQSFTGPALPNVPKKESDFWAQGINCGIEFRW